MTSVRPAGAVAPANEEAARAWDTVLYERWKRNRDVFVGALEGMTEELFDRFPPPVGGRCLDIGCGFGDTTQRLAELAGPDGFALGTDSSPHFIADARREAGVGRVLRDGVTVVIAGPPNAGKSSLLNRLAGYDAAIVTQIPGTTRDPLREHLSLDGLPVTLIDTAGLRESDDPIEAEGVKRAQRELARYLTARVAFVVARNLIHRDVYASVGIDPAVGHRAALANPHHHEMLRWSARKLVPFLREQKLIGGPSEVLWRKAHLV